MSHVQDKGAPLVSRNCTQSTFQILADFRQTNIYDYFYNLNYLIDRVAKNQGNFK